MQFPDRDSAYDSGSVTSNASEKRKASTELNEIFKKPKQAKPRREENIGNTSHGESKKPWNNKNPHNASGAKSFLHGTIYQLKHLMLILYRARKKGYCAFSLATEMDAAEKFDDLVFEYEDNPNSRVHRFLQMKHKLDDTKKITERDLLAEDDSDFSILKYFISWRKIKKNPMFSGSNSKCFFICTNIGLDTDKIDHNSMSFAKVDERDEFLEITDQKEQPPRYKIRYDPKSKLYEKLKLGSDLHQVAKALAQCVNKSKKLELKGIFKRHHIALARDIFHIEDGKATFSENFIKGNCLRETTKKFRIIFMDYCAKQSSRKKSSSPIHKIWQKKFKTSPNFGVSSGTESHDTLPADEITDDEISTFLEEFILAVGQPNENKLAEIIRCEFSSDSWLNLQNVDFLVDSFHNKILDWFKSKQGVPLVNEDADKFFDELQCQVSILITAGVSSVYTAKLNKYDVKFKREINGVVNFLAGSKSAKKLKLQLISSRKTVLTALRIWQTIKLSRKYKKKDAHIFVDLKDLLLSDIKKRIFATLKFSRGPTLLIVDCESNNTWNDSPELYRKLWNQLLKIMNDKTDTKMIIMTHANDSSVKTLHIKDDALDEIHDDISIDKLETSTQQKLLNKKVLRIQGREEKISYARILSTDIFDNLDSEDQTDCGLTIGPETLVKLINDEDIQIGDNKIMGWDEIEEYYISRMIDCHVTIAVDVLIDPEINDIIAISHIGAEALITLMTQESFRSVAFANQLQNSHLNDFKILRNGQEKHDFEKLCRDYSNEKIHWLQHESGKLILKKSFGSIANLMKYREKSGVRGETCRQGADYLTEDQMAEVADKIVIISDTAGMGKSTILSRLEEMMRDKGILTNRVDLTQNTPALASELEERSFDSNSTDKAVEFLLKKLSINGANRDSETCSIRKMMIKMRGEAAALLFDGFDEISPDYTESVIELLQALAKLPVKKLFVTTRPHMSKELEEKLGVFSHTMQPFSRSDQENFLTSFWRRELKNKESVARPSFNEGDLLKHAKRLLKLLDKSIDPSMQEFTGIPLQTRMVAEIFIYGESKLPKKIKIIDLYGRFVDKKLNILSEEKKRCDRTKPAVVESEKSTRHDWRRKHEKLALDALFDEEIVKMLLKSRPEISKLCESFADEIQAILRPGIVDKITDKPHFIHRTFAEYFAANFLFDTLKKDLRNQKVQKIFVEQVFTDLQYTTIRAFLNSFLADEKYVHPIDFWKFDLIKHRNAKGETAYHVAARERNMGIAKFLVNKLRENLQVRFSNINCISYEGKTPLIVAIETMGNTDIVKCYVKAGANKESQTNEGETPLHLAISYPRRVSVAKHLIEQEANIEAKTKDGLTPLHLAAQSGNLDVVENLTNKDANIHSQTNDGSTPLHSAARYGKLKVVVHLVKEGAKVESQNGDGKTPLHLAAQYDKLDVVKHLLKKETKINSRDNEGKTPLHLAARYGKLKVVEYLVKKVAEINSPDNERKTPLHLAAEYGKLDVVKHLVEKEADLTSRDNDGKIPLHLAVKNGKLAMVEHLVKEGVNIDSQDKDGLTPLHLAAKYGNLSLVTFLLTKGADIESRNVKRWTPLHIAILERKQKIVGYLIEKGADVQSKTVEGRTALEMMTDTFVKKTVKRLLAKKKKT